MLSIPWDHFFSILLENDTNSRSGRTAPSGEPVDHDRSLLSPHDNWPFGPPRPNCGTLRPADHPLRRIRALTDAALVHLSPVFEKLYSDIGRPSISPEQLLRALLLQVLYTVRSERLLIEQLDYNPARPSPGRRTTETAEDAMRDRLFRLRRSRQLVRVYCFVSRPSSFQNL